MKPHRTAIEQVKRFGAIQFSSDNPTIIHPQEIRREYVEDEGVWFLRAQNVRPQKVNTNNQVFISYSDAKHLEENQIKKGDVLVTRTGANRGQCAFYNRNEKAIASSHTFIIRPNEIDSQFLSIFLNTRFGKAQIDKGVYGAAQPEIAPYYLKNLWIPSLSENLIAKIKKNVTKSRDSTIKAEETQQQAETILLDELGLTDWTPYKPLSYTASAQEALVANRIDSDYFQPKYKELKTKIKRHKSRRLGEIVDYAKGVEVGSASYKNAGIPFIRVSDVSKYGFDSVGKYISQELYLSLQSEHSPQKGDILFTKDGTIGRSFVVREDKRAILSGAFLMLRMKSNIEVDLLPNYLALVISSVICKLQIEQLSDGAIISHLKPSSAMSMEIPILDKNIQSSIGKQLEISRNKHEESQELLEMAKRAVEIAIEDGEDTALTYLNKMSEAR